LIFRSKLAIAPELIIVNINIYTDFELLKVKVSLKFLGTVGFCYVGRDVTLVGIQVLQKLRKFA
jgi:hypothetical protein